MRRFPFGLTVAALLGFIILVGLGVWQVKRLAWKEGILARIAALSTAPARPLSEVLAREKAGDAAFHRVSVDCASRAAEQGLYRYSLWDSQVGWTLLEPCRIAGPRYDVVVVDRGRVARFDGAMAPGDAVFPAPAHVVGVLRDLGRPPMFGGPLTRNPRTIEVFDSSALQRIARAGGASRPVPYLLAVESESPAAAGLNPSPLPPEITNNHLVYAVTWFALALILAWFYAALMWRRIRPT